MKTEVKHFQDKGKEEPDEDLEIKTELDHKKKSMPAGTKVILGFAILILLVFLLFASFINFARRPLISESTDFNYFEIRKGISTMEIGRQLKSEKLIRSEWAFFFIAKLENRQPLQAGYYKFSAAMSTDEIINKITWGEIDAFSITIPEGYRVLQIAKALYEKGQVDYNKFIEAATGTEGTLFPDTYLFPLKIEPAKIVTQMRENYDKRTAKLKPSSDQLIIASIVEREAKKDEERPKIAALYKKRADENMLLQADPTVQYAIDSQKYLKERTLDFAFWQPITKQDYTDLNSPYNSYKQKGLPPAPICNPGIKSLEAAVKPEENFDYLFFFHDKNQEIHFSKTYQEHLEQIKKYGLSGS